MYLKCSVPYLMKILPQNLFTMPSSFSLSNVAPLVLPVALSSLIFNIIFCPFYSKQNCQNGHDRQVLNTQWLQWLSQVHSILTILFTDEIRLDKVTGTTPTSHICKGDYFTMESVYWSHRGWKFIHETKTKYEDKIWEQRLVQICNNLHTSYVVIDPYETLYDALKILCKQIVR